MKMIVYLRSCRVHLPVIDSDAQLPRTPACQRFCFAASANTYLPVIDSVAQLPGKLVTKTCLS